MALRKIELMPGKFLWRCDSCGYESHKVEVPENQLGPAPFHSCAKENGPDTRAVFEEYPEDK